MSNYLRITTTLLVLGIILNLFFWGAHPIAVNLLPTPLDKLLHGGTFTVLSCAIGLASGLQGFRMLSVAFFGALLIGALDEWHQVYLPGRHPSLDDLLADAVGSLAGAALLMLWRKLRNTHS